MSRICRFKGILGKKETVVTATQFGTLDCVMYKYVINESVNEST